MIYAVYCHLEELKLFEPDIAAALKEVVPQGTRKRRQVEVGPYIYWLRGRENHVYRIAKHLADFADGRNLTEKRTDPFQAKLLRALVQLARAFWSASFFVSTRFGVFILLFENEGARAGLH